jgi:hypothetical protein
VAKTNVMLPSEHCNLARAFSSQLVRSITTTKAKIWTATAHTTNLQNKCKTAEGRPTTRLHAIT